MVVGDAHVVPLFSLRSGAKLAAVRLLQQLDWRAEAHSSSSRTSNVQEFLLFLSEMPSRFGAKKQSILSRLAQPEGEYQDLSPKGSVDEQIRELVSEINGSEGFVTTSSCSGRVAVYLDGPAKDGDDGQ